MIKYTTLLGLRPPTKPACPHSRYYYRDHFKNKQTEAAGFACQNGCGIIIPAPHDYKPDWCNDCDPYIGEHYEHGSGLDHGECLICTLDSYHPIHHNWRRKIDGS